jgi:hypothetical protein
MRSFQDNNDMKYMRESIEAYDRIMKEVSNDTNYIHNPCRIAFDKWVDSKLYRELIASQLGLPFTDEGLNLLGQPGKGSSFDGYEYRYNAQEMDVNNRHKLMSDNNLYVRYLNGEPLKRWSEYENN